MAVRVTHRLKEWRAREQVRLRVALLDLGAAIHRDAQNLAPFEKGNLRASGRIKQSGLKAEVSFGGGSVRYARRRHYENRKNPHTLHYLQRAGDANSRNFKRYLGK